MDVSVAASKLIQLSLGSLLCRIVWAAADLKLADALHDNPQTAKDLARSLSLDAPSLERLLNALVVNDYFSKDKDGKYQPTELGSYLRSDNPDSLWGYVASRFGNPSHDALRKISEAVRTGKCAFVLEHGETSFDRFSAHPEEGRLFALGMTSTTKALEGAIMSAHDFGPFTRAVDVGGSQGSLLTRLLAENSEANGVIFDRPEVILAGQDEWSRGVLGERIKGVAGDFFKALPPGDLYLLKYIVHDWPDAESIEILKNIRKVIAADGRINLIEYVLPDTLVQHPAWLADISMLAFTGGRERSQAQFDALLEQSGFARTKVTQTSMGVGVIEARPI